MITDERKFYKINDIIDKYEYLTSEEILLSDQSRVIEQATTMFIIF